MNQIRDELQQECNRQDCFLCRPNAALLVHVGEVGYVVSGVGPLADGYAVLATHDHLSGLKEVDPEFLGRYAKYAAKVASILAKEYGGCLVVEHGNMAVCGVSEEGRKHCLHPHFLLIPDKRLNINSFLEFFPQFTSFENIEEALIFASSCNQYIFAGLASGPFYVFVPNAELPRQFARGLVAEQLEVEHLASWKDAPSLENALSNAIRNRRILKNVE